jgi:hypothetical protein
MIEPIMYFGIGFLFAALIGVAVAPLIHDRAVRLTMRRLESSIPQSMAEIQADKDLLRAEFAMSTRRLEIDVEQLKEQTTSQLADLGRKGDVINRLKIERQAQKVETFALKTEVESLKEQLVSIGRGMTVEFQRHEPNLVSLVPKDWPRAEPERAAADTTAPSGLRHESEAMSLVLQRPTAEGTRPIQLTPNSGRGPSDQHIETAQDAASVSGALRAEPAIHVSSDDQIAHEGSVAGGRRVLRGFLVLALMGVGATFAWRSYDDGAKEMVKAWAPSLNGLIFASTEKLPATQAPNPPAQPAASAPSAELAQQLDDLARDLADARSTVEQSTAKQEREQSTTNQEQSTKQEQNAAAPQPVAQEQKQKLSFTDPQSRPNPAPFPDTKPTTIAGWALLEVVDGTAVVQGPNGVWRVTRGDTVPGVGKIDSIVRWGNRWIVATSKGLISTP